MIFKSLTVLNFTLMWKYSDISWKNYENYGLLVWNAGDTNFIIEHILVCDAEMYNDYFFPIMNSVKSKNTLKKFIVVLYHQHSRQIYFFDPYTNSKKNHDMSNNKYIMSTSKNFFSYIPLKILTFFPHHIQHFQNSNIEPHIPFITYNYIHLLTTPHIAHLKNHHQFQNIDTIPT